MSKEDYDDLLKDVVSKKEEDDRAIAYARKLQKETEEKEAKEIAEKKRLEDEKQAKLDADRAKFEKEKEEFEAKKIEESTKEIEVIDEEIPDVDEVFHETDNEIEEVDFQEEKELSNAEKAILKLVSINWFFDNWYGLNEEEQQKIIDELQKIIG